VKSCVGHQTKNKFRLALPLSLLRRWRPKSVNILGVSKFHPNPFTSGEVIAERVNVIETRHKVFPILREATASSPSNKTLKHFKLLLKFYFNMEP